VTLHDLAPLHFPDFFFNSPRKFNNYKRHLAYIRKNADFILTVSRYSKKDIAEKLSYPADRIFRIYNGVDSKFKKLETNSNQVEFTKRKFDLPEKFILFVGGLDFRKNIATLIKAFKLVQEKTMFKEHKLVIAGNNLVRNNKFYPPLEKISQDLFMDKQVIFLRAFNDEDLVALYNLAMLFVFPSTFEGFGFPPLEAMACGCPVLCSNRCSLPEVVNDAAVLFEPEDTLHLANLMQELLLSSQLLSDLAKKGIERAKFFSWEKAAQETIAVYKELAA
jgi:glycosyltransferase involved in cell wall biosynthesis